MYLSRYSQLKQFGRTAGEKPLCDAHCIDWDCKWTSATVVHVRLNQIALSESMPHPNKQANKILGEMQWRVVTCPGCRGESAVFSNHRRTADITGALSASFCHWTFWELVFHQMLTSVSSAAAQCSYVWWAADVAPMSSDSVTKRAFSCGLSVRGWIH